MLAILLNTLRLVFLIRKMAAIMCTSQGCQVDEMNEHIESTHYGTLELTGP